MNTGGRSEPINLVVRPALRDGDPSRGFFLVVFEETREGMDFSAHDDNVAEPGARQLDEELVRLETQMRATVEQYEVQTEESKAANEELQAMNEELRSTAEELETSQEELQSVNEELQTVNQELKVKIEEISHADDDMRNLMSSTEIGTIFVDRSLRVKLFTPRARDIFNLIPVDVGRPLLDITTKLSVEGLAADIERVLERLQTIEHEVETRDGNWHLLRLLQAIIDSSPLAIVSIDARQHVKTWNASAEQMFGVPAAGVIGKTIHELGEGVEGARRILVEAMGDGGATLPRETAVRRKDGTQLSASIFPAPLRAADGTVYAVMGLLQDITERKRLEEERERLLRRIVSSQEAERQRIARELHDELGQHLTALKMGLETLQPAGDRVQRMKNLVGEIDRSIDRLTLEFRPPVLDDVGLSGAITSLVEQFTDASGIRADVHCTGTEGARLSDAIETSLYRVLQEALTNVWKHAHAKSVSVIVERTPEQVQLIVEDDGSGFEQSEGDGTDEGARGRFGLLGIRERVSLIGGSFNIESAPGQGTTLYVRVPL